METIDELLARAVAKDPARLAVVGDGARWSYGELAERVERLAAGLQALGIQPEERVAILDKNGPHYLELYFALPKIGAVAVPLNYRLAPAELAYILEDSTATTLIHGLEYAETARALTSAKRHIPLDASYQALLIDAEPTPVSRQGDDVFL